MVQAIPKKKNVNLIIASNYYDISQDDKTDDTAVTTVDVKIEKFSEIQNFQRNKC